jgi:hypothetical protein
MILLTQKRRRLEKVGQTKKNIWEQLNRKERGTSSDERHCGTHTL